MVRSRNTCAMVFLSLFAFMLHSCSDDSNPVNNNNDNTNKVNEKLLQSYYPLSAGSKWVYDMNANNTSQKEYTQYNIKDTVINGKKYVEGLFTLGGTKFYAREENNIIYSYNTDVSASEYKTYDFNEVGNTFEIESSSFFYTTIDRIELTRKFALDTVAGKIYKDCCELRVRTYNKDTGGLLQTRNAYFSRGVGLYYYNFYTPDYSQSGEVSLREYELK